MTWIKDLRINDGQAHIQSLTHTPLYFMTHTTLLPIVPILASLLLSAHFFHAGTLGLAIAWAVFPLLLLHRGAWIKPVMQAALALGMMIWIQTMADLILFRQAFGLPWLRVALILGGVALLTGFGVLGFEHRALRARYSRDRDKAAVQAGAFVLTALGLGLLYLKLPFPILLADRFAPGTGPIQILGMSCYSAWISGKLLDPKRAPALRSRLWMFFSLVFFAQLGLGLAGWEQFLMTGKLHLPVPALILAGPIYRGEGFFMLGLFLSTIFLVGPAWCSHLCYIGAWDAKASASRKAPMTLPNWTSRIRLGVFALVLLTALGLRTLGVHWSWAVMLAAIFGLFGIGIMVWISRKTGVMVHCTTFCPISLAAVLLGKLVPWRLRIDPACDACGACSRSCRYQALQPEHLDRKKPGLSCTLCGDCIARCRNNRLSYGFIWLSATNSRRLFVLLVTTLHTVFLATARI